MRRAVPSRTVALAVVALLAGCAVGPDFKAPAPPAVGRYSRVADPVMTDMAQGAAQRFDAGTAVTGRWWEFFGSAALNGLVAQALEANPGVTAAEDSLRQSEDSLRAGYGVFYPAATLEGQGGRLRRAALPAESVPAGIYNLFTLSASVSYALDVFGGERRYLEVLRAQVDLQRETVRGTYLTLEGDVINAVIAHAAYRAQAEATRELIRLTEEQVRLTEVRVTAGTEPYSAVLSLKSLLAQYQASVPALQQKVTQAEDLLASLTGRLPAETPAPQLTLAQLSLPLSLPVSLPSQLARQRPDIKVAEAALHAAGANVGVATAALFPSVSLSAGYGGNANTTGMLFTSGSRAWSAGAAATQPLFEGGSLWFRRRAAIDTWQQAQAQYRQTVLAGFEQVADALGALTHDATALAAQERSLSAARDALQLVQTQYAAGLDTYLEVLNADAQYQQAALDDIQASALRYQDTVALFIALGGSALPEEAGHGSGG